MAALTIRVTSKRDLIDEEDGQYIIVPQGMTGRILGGNHHPRGKRLDPQGEVGLFVMWDLVAIQDLDGSGYVLSHRATVIRPDAVICSGEIV